MSSLEAKKEPHQIKEYSYVRVIYGDERNAEFTKVQGLHIKDNGDFLFNLVDRKTDVKLLTLLFEG